MKQNNFLKSKLKPKKSSFLKFSVFTIAIGGLLFGYQTGIIAGALLFLIPAFELTTSDQGVLVSTILISAMAGSLFGGPLADRVGRRKTMIAMAALVAFGTILVAIAQSYFFLLIGRFVIGLAIGTISMVSPLYLAELSPSSMRGGMISFYQFFINVGILTSFLIGFLFSDSGQWRLMFAIGIIPALFQLVALFFIPETPSWLSKKGRKEEVTAILKRLYSTTESFGSFSSTPEQPTSWKQVFSKKYRFILFLGCGLSICQQITGINIIIYYAPVIFQTTGFTSAADGLFATVGVGAINALATLIAVFFLDRLGRRKLLLTSVFGMMLSLTTLSLALFANTTFIDKISLVSLMVYVVFFAIGLGPGTFVVISELYPTGIRAKAMSLATFFNWFSSYWISLLFPNLVATIGQGWTFLCVALITLFSFLFIFRYIPETSNRNLEEI